MALTKRQFICSVDEYAGAQGEKKTAYFRIGELLTFRDQAGNVFQRFKDYRAPSQKFVLFDDDKKKGS